MATLYRKYRPKTFSEIRGQAHVIRTLTNSVKSGRIGHAYLFTGPRGTGKTTLARIFAKTVNCENPVLMETKEKSQKDISPVAVEPCNECKSCELILQNKALDIIEIDAASHTGVDNMRQLKETIELAPSILKYKIYIIDEVHMLSMGAFNALLKTLEEPPAHAIFILATTELHKVPETIVSRCQRFDIAHLSQEQIIQRLAQISEKEKTKIEAEALEAIAAQAEGGMRDAESLLGQIISLEDSNITATEVNEILGTSSKKAIADFAQLILQDDIQKTLEVLDETQKEGVNLKNFNKGLLSYFRSLAIIQTSPAAAKKILSSFSKEQFEEARKISENSSLVETLSIIELLQKSLGMLKETTIPQLPLEMALIEIHLRKNPTPPAAVQTPQKQEVAQIKKEAPKETQPTAPTEEKEAPEPIKQEAPTPETKEEDAPRKKSNATLEDVLEKWSQIIEGMKPHNHSIHAFLENCTPAGVSDGTLYIKTKYDFYKEKLSEVNNKLTIQKVVDTIMGGSLNVSFVTEKECDDIKMQAKEKKEDKRNVLHDAMKVFGGKIT